MPQSQPQLSEIEWTGSWIAMSVILIIGAEFLLAGKIVIAIYWFAAMLWECLVVLKMPQFPEECSSDWFFGLAEEE